MRSCVSGARVGDLFEFDIFDQYRIQEILNVDLRANGLGGGYLCI